MGQVINVTKITVSGDAAVFDSDRSLSGQDGSGYSSAPDAAEVSTVPARLAAAIFAADSKIVHVYVASNGVVVKREDGWDDSVTAATAGVIREFFVFYRG